MILTAGFGAHRVNPSIVRHTKNRVLLGGVPVQMVSLNRRPPYRTPLLISCCKYKNPFVEETKDLMTQSVTSNRADTDLSWGDPEIQKRRLSRTPSLKPKGNRTHFYPYWMEIIYLHHSRIFESHSGGQMMKQLCPTYKINKTPCVVDYQPH